MRLTVETDLRIQMRDGVTLVADLHRPQTREPLPVLIQRTPYGRQGLSQTNAQVDYPRLVRGGYAVLVQDARGRYASEGEFTPFQLEAQDGEDTIAWAAAQPWSSGRVGMFGPSYVGAAQWLAARQAPPALGAIAPAVTGDDYYQGWTYQGGALQRGFLLHWLTLFLALGEAHRRLAFGTGTQRQLEAAVEVADRCDSFYSEFPPYAWDHLVEYAPYVRDWLAHPHYDDYWSALAPREHYHQVQAPALNVGGWYDIFLGGTLRNFNGMRQHGGGARARDQQRLVVGPWAHGVYGGDFPERSFGIRGGVDGCDLTGTHLRWFDWQLRDLDDGIGSEPPLRLFVTGQNEWRYENQWPPAECVPTSFHLASVRGANGSTGDGALLPEVPGSGAQVDSYRHDPGDPVPTVGGQTFLPGMRVGRDSGPADQRPIEARPDVLCYTSTVLRQELLLIGRLAAVLFVSSTAASIDLVAHLTDVWPEGRSELVASGITRVGKRGGGEDPPLRPRVVYRVEVDLLGAAHRFRVGHRFRLIVSSSSFPRFDVNRGDGAVSLAPTTGGVVATNYLHHTPTHDSHLVLPVIPERD